MSPSAKSSFAALELLLGIRPVGLRLFHLRRVPGPSAHPAAVGRGEPGLDLPEGRPLLVQAEAQLHGEDLHQGLAPADPVPTST